MTFTLEELKLPHNGIIPGAAGHKKVIVSKGTKVYAVKYERRYFTCVYLYKSEAEGVIRSFEETIKPDTRRHIPLTRLIEWNFRYSIPTRVNRPRVKIDPSAMHGG